MNRVLLLIIVLVTTARPGAAADRPNLIFIMADDLGWADVGYNGAKFYETPHIDALRASGMEFRSAYPGASNCMPSRACIMSGMYTPRTGMWTPGMKAKGEKAFMKFLVPRRSDKSGDAAFPSKAALDPSVTSVAETLKSAGYKTAHFGKWHLGPDGQGFDVNDTNGLGAGLDKKWYGNVDVAETLTNATADYIRENKGGPFFIYLCHWDVHTPIRARKEVVAKYRRKLGSDEWDRKWNPTYAAMVEAVDTSVGRVREALQENGIADNTLLVFTSDNGGHSGATWCEPLKGAKGAFYEGGIRVPACVSWPNVVKAGSTCDVPITGVDVLPTFAELGGAELPTGQPIDGRSWAPLLRGEEALRDRAVFWHYPLYLAGAGYNQVIPVHGTDRMYWRATPCSVIRRGDWKLIEFFESDSVELYNLREDPGESRDLSGKYRERAAEMRAELRRWRAESGAVMPESMNPDFNPQSQVAPKGKRKGKNGA